MVEIPGPKTEEEEDLFDGNAEMERLLGLERRHSHVGGWIKNLSETDEDDLIELVTGERPSVDGSGSPEVDSLPGPVVADKSSTG